MPVPTSGRPPARSPRPHLLRLESGRAPLHWDCLHRHHCPSLAARAVAQSRGSHGSASGLHGAQRRRPMRQARGDLCTISRALGPHLLSPPLALPFSGRIGDRCVSLDLNGGDHGRARHTTSAPFPPRLLGSSSPMMSVAPPLPPPRSTGEVTSSPRTPRRRT